jgi:hypothetical protein
MNKLWSRVAVIKIVMEFCLLIVWTIFLMPFSFAAGAVSCMFLFLVVVPIIAAFLSLYVGAFIFGVIFNSLFPRPM